MTDGVLLLIGVLWIANVVLQWQQTRALQSMAGASLRERDRDRRDHLGMIQRLLEKQTNPDLALRTHAQERAVQVQADAGVEKASMNGHRPPSVPDEFVSEMDATPYG